MTESSLLTFSSTTLRPRVAITPAVSGRRPNETFRVQQEPQTGGGPVTVGEGITPPRLCSKTVRASFPVHGSSVLGPLSRAALRTCKLGFYAFP